MQTALTICRTFARAEQFNARARTFYLLTILLRSQLKGLAAGIGGDSSDADAQDAISKFDEFAKEWIYRPIRSLPNFSDEWLYHSVCSFLARTWTSI